MTFAGGGGNVTLFDPSGFSAAIGGFGRSDVLDLATFASGPGLTSSFTEAASHASGTLAVTNAGKHVDLTLLGSYATSNFAVTGDGGSGTLVKFT